MRFQVSLMLWIRFLMVCVCDCNSDAAHEGPSRPIPTVLSHRHHHHHQGASFIGVVVVVDDALVALICRNVVVLREKFLVLALFNSAYSKVCWKRLKASFGHMD